MCYSSLIQVLAVAQTCLHVWVNKNLYEGSAIMSKSNSEAMEKPGTGILRMARVNSNLYVNRENIWKTCNLRANFIY